MASHRTLLSILISLLIIPLGCSDDKDGAEDTDPATETTTGDSATETSTTGDDTGDSGTSGTAEGDYTLTLTAPAEGDTVEADVTMTFTVEGLTLDADGMGGAPVADHGHVHIYLDGKYFDATAETSYTFDKLPLGEHALKVILAQNDHLEYADTEQSVTVTVAEPQPPSVAIISPDPGAETAGSSVTLGLQIDNFEVLHNPGADPVEGEGHYHVYLNGDYYNYDSDPDETLVSNLPPGDHELRVVLSEHDHTELKPEISDTITVTVPVGSPAISLEVPADFAEVDSASLPITVSVGDFALVNNLGGANVDGQGHYHIYLDGAYVTATAANETALLHTDGGDHTVEVWLSENDHTELAVGDSARVTIPEDRPDVEIDSPPNGEVVTSDFTLSVSLENFTLDPDNIGNSHVDGQGHYHVYLDGAYKVASAESSVEITGVSSGEHTIEVYLAQNDHALVDPEVLDLITINVP